ncbi:anaphase-promoting complex, subunit 10-domain-containing protein [Xylaria acuta]|nr:anaphase-promoting complex, subunit 10-domain-containing protein [Xylaria acuta]
MDSREVERGEASTSTYGTRRQQAREYRRRLLRSSRTAGTAHNDDHHDHYHGAPMPAVEDEDRAYDERPQPGVSPDPRWAFQTPQERMARHELPRPPIRGFSGSEDGDLDVVAGADVDRIEGSEGAVEHEVDEVREVEDAEEEEEEEQPFDASAVGLKEISNLASFTVSSYKPGCGVKELRDDDANQYWQSDGPQPHRLNIHFIKRVEIRALRLYLDYELDESYTPTKIQITAGTGPNLTIPFTTLELNMPKGWVDVPIAGAGGGPDGNSLCCFFVRVIILENHQNGKDTHIRGIKVYALDEGADTVDNNPIDDVVNDLEDYRMRMKRMSLGESDDDTLMRLDAQARKRKANAKKHVPGEGGLSIPDFMREPEIR